MHHTYTFLNDPAHAWLKVPKTLVDQLGIGGKISRYSYVDDRHAYLEEDCDAPVLIRALEARGDTVAFKEHYCHSSCFVRSLARWEPAVPG